MSNDLIVRTEDNVRWLVLNRPHVGNSVNRAVQRTLVEQLRIAGNDPAVRVIVLAAAGIRHFCTGPDLGDPEMTPSTERIPGDATRMLREGSQAVVTALLDCEKPVICALNGTAAGVGASMALACDLIIAVRQSRFAELFVRRGLAPDGGAAYLLARRVPMNVAKELLLFGDDLHAAEAHRLGLVNKLVEEDELQTEVTAWANRLARGATRAQAAAKAMLNQALDVDRAGALAVEALLVEQVAGTADVAEGIAAFQDRREPHFRGR